MKNDSAQGKGSGNVPRTFLHPQVWRQNGDAQDGAKHHHKRVCVCLSVCHNAIHDTFCHEFAMFIDAQFGAAMR